MYPTTDPVVVFETTIVPSAQGEVAAPMKAVEWLTTVDAATDVHVMVLVTIHF